jgi:hypothetical protein
MSRQPNYRNYATVLKETKMNSKTRHNVFATVCLFSFAALSHLTHTARAADETKIVTVRDLTLQVPSNWVQEEPKSKLRLAQFRIPSKEGKDAELLVFSFGASDPAANIRRWTEQYEPEGRVMKLFSGESSHGKYYLVDLTGTSKRSVGPPNAGKTESVKDSGTLAIGLNIKDKGVYYLKLNGPKDTVAEQRAPLRTAMGADISKEKEYQSNKE